MSWTFSYGWPCEYLTRHTYQRLNEADRITDTWQKAPLAIDFAYCAIATICSGAVAERLRRRATKSRLSVGGIMLVVFSAALFFALTRPGMPLREWEWSSDFMRAFPDEWPDCIQPAYAIAYFGLVCIVLCALWLFKTLFVALASSARSRLQPAGSPSDF